MTVPTAFLLSREQGQAARSLLHYASTLNLPAADAQLLAVVVVSRAARTGQSTLTARDLQPLADAARTLGDLARLGWHIAIDPSRKPGQQPVRITVPPLTGAHLEHPLPIGKLTRSRLSAWVTATLSHIGREAGSTTAEGGLAALTLAAHSAANRHGRLPAEFPRVGRAVLPGLLSRGYIRDWRHDHYLLDESAWHLVGHHTPRIDPGFLSWQRWKELASRPLRRHVDTVENCALCRIPAQTLVQAFTSGAAPPQFSPRIRDMFGSWKGNHPDRGPLAAQFVAAFWARHRHGPSEHQVRNGLGWGCQPLELTRFVIYRLITTGWLSHNPAVPWTLGPGPAAPTPRQETTDRPPPCPPRAPHSVHANEHGEYTQAEPSARTPSADGPPPFGPHSLPRPR
ncbi:hypothetical protein ACIO3O_23915 [Streptomyces sp. NPDC087440]|uniref:hypothetical protein n=1 Tax=Streptomyces sp. NPDC087440 TaxID=3365790 RepID=UPI00382225AF